MTVFIKKKKDVKNLKLRTLQGMILEQLLRRLAHFWSPFGSIWVVLVLLLAPFEFVTIPFHSLWLAFGSQIFERTFWNTFSKAPWETTRPPGLRTPPSLRARSGSNLPAARFRSGPIGTGGCEGQGAWYFLKVLCWKCSKKFFQRFGNQKRAKESEKGS